MMMYRVGGYLWTFFWVVIALFLLVSSIEHFFFGRSRTSLQAVSVAPMNAPDDERAKREQLAQSRQDEAISLAKQALENVNKAQAQIDVWVNEIEPLQGNAEGQRIASDEDLARELYWLFREKRMTRAELDEINQHIDDLNQTVQSVAQRAGGATPLSADALVRLRSLHGRAADAEESWRKANEAAMAVRRDVERASLAEADQSLGKMFEHFDDRKAMVDLKDRQDQLARKNEQEERLKEQQQTLHAQAQSEETRRYLGVFFEPRRVQPDRAGGRIVMRRSFEEQPISLSALEKIRALDTSLEGLEALARVGGHRDLSRSRWSIPASKNRWTDEQQKFLEHAQELLRRLGPTLVDEGLLAL